MISVCWGNKVSLRGGDATDIFVLHLHHVWGVFLMGGATDNADTQTDCTLLQCLPSLALFGRTNRIQ